MARQLEFKRRVRLPAEAVLEPRVQRSANPTYVGALAWLALTLASYLLLDRWLTHQIHARATASRALAASHRQRVAELREPPPAEELAPPSPPPEPAPPPLAPLAEEPATPNVLRGAAVGDALDEASSEPKVSLPEPEPAPSETRARKKSRRAGSISGAIRSPTMESDPEDEVARAPRRPAATVRERDDSNVQWAERSSGPRITSLLEPFDPALEPSPPAPSAPDKQLPAPAGSGSCEDAVARYREQIDLEHPDHTPDISASAYSAILNNGSYFAHCGIPSRTRIQICAAVQRGHAVGVTVHTFPANAAAARCIRESVRRLHFPNHPKLDVTHTEFAPE